MGDRLGEEPAATSNAVGQFVAQMQRAGVETGISPSVVAHQMVAAIKAGQCWILTHSDLGRAVTERYRRAVAQVNPV